MESKYDLGNILQPNVELHQAEEEEPNGLVVSIDQKIAFLSELKELLIKYDAKITWNFGIRKLDEDGLWQFQLSPMLRLKVGNEKINYTGKYVYDATQLSSFDITPSNIFDYDK